MAFRRLALAALAGAAAVLMVAGASAQTASSTLVGDGIGAYVAPQGWVSNDGRYVVFNGTGGLTLGDTVDHTTTVIAGAPSNYTAGATVSGDGRYVAYLDGQGNAKLWDRTTATSETVSLTDDEQSADASYYGATVSGDGRYVAFLSCDPDLQPPTDCGSGGYNGEAIYLRDRVNGTTGLINETPNGDSAVGSPCSPSLSDDGGVAAWEGYLLTGADAGNAGVVVWARATNTLRVVEANGLLGDPPRCSSGDLGPMVSGNGRYVVWSRSNDSGIQTVRVGDLQTNTIEEIVAGTNGIGGTYLGGASISDDGRYLAFSNDNYDAYRYDRQTQTAIQVNYDPQGNRVDADAITGISGDGNKIAFSAGNKVYVASVTTPPPPPPAHLELAKTQQDCTPSCSSPPTSNPIAVDFHDTIRYTVTVRNTGGSPASNIHVVDQLPVGVTVTQVVAPSGTTCATSQANGNRGIAQVQCTIATVGPASSQAIAVVGTVSLAPSPCTIVGTSRDDTMAVPVSSKVKGHSEVICGLGGSDTITGGDGNDVIYGDVPPDLQDPGPLVNGAWIDRGKLKPLPEMQASVSATIRVGTGAADTIDGQAGNDTIYGQDGGDIVHGGEGNDNIHGADGNDQLFGDAGNDTMTGGDGIDKMAGGDGNDSLVGNADNDLLLGQAGNDSLEGAAGIDRLDGGGGNDTLGGGGSAVSGGPPPPNTINNILSGGPGRDLCSYGPIRTLATRTDRGDIRGTSCEDPPDPKSQKTTWNGSTYTFSYRNIDDTAAAHASVFDWNAFDGTPLP